MVPYLMVTEQRPVAVVVGFWPVSASSSAQRAAGRLLDPVANAVVCGASAATLASPFR